MEIDVSRANIKYDILQGGMEISAATLASSGTLGAIVYSTEGSKPMILTNKHVVAGDEQQARESIQLLKLKVQCGVRPAWWKDEYGAMLDEKFPVFQPAYRGGTNRESRLVGFVKAMSTNSDAAVCPLADGVPSNSYIMASPDFPISGIGKARRGMLVMKSGKETSVTWGVVTAVNGEDIIIQHPFHDLLPISGAGVVTGGREALETDANLLLRRPLVQGAISAAGDSGAVWVNADTKEAVGLLYSGQSPFTHGTNYSVAKDMESVATKLKFTFG
jgi:hypothetical protein